MSGQQPTASSYEEPHSSSNNSATPAPKAKHHHHHHDDKSNPSSSSSSSTSSCACTFSLFLVSLVIGYLVLTLAPKGHSAKDAQHLGLISRQPSTSSDSSSLSPPPLSTADPSSKRQTSDAAGISWEDASLSTPSPPSSKHSSNATGDRREDKKGAKTGFGLTYKLDVPVRRSPVPTRVPSSSSSFKKNKINGSDTWGANKHDDDDDDENVVQGEWISIVPRTEMLYPTYPTTTSHQDSIGGAGANNDLVVPSEMLQTWRGGGSGEGGVNYRSMTMMSLGARYCRPLLHPPPSSTSTAAAATATATGVAAKVVAASVVGSNGSGTTVNVSSSASPKPPSSATSPAFNSGCEWHNGLVKGGATFPSVYQVGAPFLGLASVTRSSLGEGKLALMSAVFLGHQTLDIKQRKKGKQTEYNNKASTTSIVLPPTPVPKGVNSYRNKKYGPSSADSGELTVQGKESPMYSFVNPKRCIAQGGGGGGAGLEETEDGRAIIKSEVSSSPPSSPVVVVAIVPSQPPQKKKAITIPTITTIRRTSILFIGHSHSRYMCSMLCMFLNASRCHVFMNNAAKRSVMLSNETTGLSSTSTSSDSISSPSSVVYPILTWVQANYDLRPKLSLLDDESIFPPSPSSNTNNNPAVVADVDAGGNGGSPLSSASSSSENKNASSLSSSSSSSSQTQQQQPFQFSHVLLSRGAWDIMYNDKSPQDLVNNTVLGIIDLATKYQSAKFILHLPHYYYSSVMVANRGGGVGGGVGGGGNSAAAKSAARDLHRQRWRAKCFAVPRVVMMRHCNLCAALRAVEYFNEQQKQQRTTTTANDDGGGNKDDDDFYQRLDFFDFWQETKPPPPPTGTSDTKKTNSPPPSSSSSSFAKQFVDGLGHHYLDVVLESMTMKFLDQHICPATTTTTSRSSNETSSSSLSDDSLRRRDAFLAIAQESCHIVAVHTKARKFGFDAQVMMAAGIKDGDNDGGGTSRNSTTTATNSSQLPSPTPAPTRDVSKELEKEEEEEGKAGSGGHVYLQECACHNPRFEKMPVCRQFGKYVPSLLERN